MKKKCNFNELVDFVKSYKKHLEEYNKDGSHIPEITVLESVIKYAKKIKGE